MAHQRGPGTLTLEIRAQRIVFGPGDPVLLEGRLSNTSGTPVLVNRRFLFPGPEVYLQLRDPSGRALAWLPPEPPPPLRPADFTTLAPGGALGFLLPDLRSWVQHGLTPGLYTAAATFHNRGAPELGWRTLEEEVTSPAVSFRIAAAR